MSKKEEKNISELLPKKKNLKHLNIYFHCSENSGVGLYRQYLWAKELQDKGLANILISDFRWGMGNHINPDMEKLFALGNWADLFVIGRLDRPDWLAQWGAIREFFNLPIVMDTDDNVRFVRPTNPGYQGYHPGSEATYWNKFAFRKIFDAITVSTNNLKEFHKNEHPKIYVFPNSLDMKAWKVKKKVWKDDKIRINFNGSSAHTESVQIIKQPLLKIMQKYSNVLFSIPFVFKKMFEDYPQEIKNKITFLPWIKLEDFPKEMANLGIDIGLAPLADNLFNRAKSNLRWMEYSALKIPVIYSPIEAYDCVDNNVDGLVALEREEWYNAMEKLIKDKSLRIKLSDNAYEKVKKQFNIEINAKKYLPVYEEIVRKHRAFFGDKKKFRPEGKNKWREIKRIV